MERIKRVVNTGDEVEAEQGLGMRAREFSFGPTLYLSGSILSSAGGLGHHFFSSSI